MLALFSTGDMRAALPRVTVRAGN
ncbi:hypothetical protein XFF6166_370015 [Xanthomonas citri pv. fuscans]|uniref:Uncharacterized protein n=1 Tax=Xanthomonas campestris pv. phaseoli TaxID=317013 RepID=A0A7Z7IY98_XANCH|nr:hypothetical protein XFF6166_370015 [Xanthomonas citri pv. fuscans]SOO22720.1 hypothetical protein XFF6991_150484 [Xanthomonas phaseoli pv. phaseoli]SON96524.1 hypothetical protein XFF6990_340028 [Xanthomonas citri pv. fuscans]SON99520.1 hypothetical protein XFF6960_180016 [Xanthomonas citri pv. fuscans]SOO05874.1 hypothetical protein XFF7767_50104 [Xanthomonas citri pv. fuscans]